MHHQSSEQPQSSPWDVESLHLVIPHPYLSPKIISQVPNKETVTIIPNCSKCASICWGKQGLTSTSQGPLQWNSWPNLGHEVRTRQSKQQRRAQFSASKDARQHHDDQQPGTNPKNDKRSAEESEVQCQPTKDCCKVYFKEWFHYSHPDAQEWFHQKILKITLLSSSSSSSSASSETLERENIPPVSPAENNSVTSKTK